MKLLHVMPTYLPAVRYGGPMHSVHALCRHLVARGHEVHVCTTSMDGPADLDVALGQPVDMDGVRVWYFRADRLRRLAVSSGMRRWIAERTTDFDLLHTHTVYLWPVWHAARMARLRGVPYVIAPRGMLVPELIARRKPFAKRLWLRWLEHRNLAHADALHFTSAMECDDARRLGIPVRRAAVIANGIDLEPIDAVCGAGAGTVAGPYVLHLGRIHWKKGLDHLVRALALLPDVQAVFAGHDEEGCRESLERLARECGVADRVRFLEPVQGEAKWRLLRDARMLVLPSQSENFANAVLEAMASRIPVVVSPGVGLAAAVGEARCGLVVAAEPGALVAAIHGLWDDAGQRQSMGERGRALVEREYTWNEIAGQMEALYRSILEARATGAQQG